MDHYEIFRCPFDRPLEEMTKRELKELADWFHGAVPYRIKVLEGAVRATPGFEGWRPDLSPESLIPLSLWFEKQVETQKKTKAEFEADKALLGELGEPRGWTLTEKTASIAADVGIYFGQVVLKNVPGTRWSQVLRNKRDFHYGRPVIVGSGKAPLEPIGIMLVSALKVVSGERADFGKLYRIHERLLRGERFHPGDKV